ncbi:hypothetical protein [Tessaracoccus flavus]|uniref:Uncharacterized protein n=1 Tax=Tessaracoccus flavus TaxID=1610493 RepID=A0A1Q2CH30_9ACTN|nr:hypothetical protein [Tessaracoccus flavus]AQP45355.1 hypothetical protein RPIT_11560 [Tessaracoccus flavus]SDY94282.1 hypothetical protein SAMN05428934_106163 [Tessaracoccus flavus]
MQSERFAVGLTPLPTAARVTRQRSALRMRILSTVISMALLVAIIWFLGRDWSTAWTVGLVIAWVASSAFWFVLSVVGLQRAKRDLASIDEGVAFYLDPQGIEFVHPTPARISWQELSALKLVGRNFGAGPSIVAEAGGRRVAGVPVSFLDASPAVIDSAARAYSLGRANLDTAALDHLL